jgi:hypothetical protein
MKWSFKRFIKNVGRLAMGLMVFWLVFSFIDLNFARTMYGCGHLSCLNIIEIL